MNVRWVLGTACVLLGFLVVIRVLLLLHTRRKATAGRDTAVAGNGQRRTDVARLRRIDEMEFRRMHQMEPDITVFHLADGHHAEVHAADLPGELIVTWAELEEAIRWAPHGTSIVIYRSQEMDDTLVRRLAMFTQRHEVLLLCGRSEGMENQLRRA